MIHIIGPRQDRLFDPFEGVIPPAGQRIISSGWQGVFRQVLLKLSQGREGLRSRLPLSQSAFEKIDTYY